MVKWLNIEFIIYFLFVLILGMLLIMALITNLWLSSCGVHREQYFRSKRPNRAVYALLGLCHYPEKGQVENFTQLGNMTQIEAPYIM